MRIEAVDAVEPEESCSSERGTCRLEHAPVAQPVQWWGREGVGVERRGLLQVAVLLPSASECYMGHHGHRQTDTCTHTGQTAVRHVNASEVVTLTGSTAG